MSYRPGLFGVVAVAGVVAGALGAPAAYDADAHRYQPSPTSAVVLADWRPSSSAEPFVRDSDVCRGGPGQGDMLVVDPFAGEDRGFLHGPSLEQAVGALPRAGLHVIYVRGGVYRLRRPLVLTQAASGVAVMACPGETPVLEGPFGAPAVILRDSRKTSLAGLLFAGPSSVHVLLDGAQDCVIEHNVFLDGTAAILLDHASGNSILRNEILRMATTGVEIKDGSDANVVADNVVDGTDAPETSGGGIFLHGARDNRIAHNLVQNTAGFGIGVSNWDDATVNVGNVVEYNLLRRTALTAVDSGAVYVLGRSGLDTGIVIAGNVIDGVGAITGAAGEGAGEKTRARGAVAGRHDVGIYLDDSTSGAVVTHNLVRRVGSDAVQIHGGSDNLVENNLIDLGGARPSAVLFQAAPADTHPLNLQTGNAVLRNVILSSNPNPRLFVWYDGGSPLVSGNLYATGAEIAAPRDSPVFDRQPVIADPALARDAATDGYAAVQKAATEIGFKPLDLGAAGVRGPASSR